MEYAASTAQMRRLLLLHRSSPFEGCNDESFRAHHVRALVHNKRQEAARSRKTALAKDLSIKKVFGDETMVVMMAGMAVFGTGLEMSVINVALPMLAQEFGVGPNRVAWVVLACNLPLVALLLPLGRWVDVQKIIEALERPPSSPTKAKT